MITEIFLLYFHLNNHCFTVLINTFQGLTVLLRHPATILHVFGTSVFYFAKDWYAHIFSEFFLYNSLHHADNRKYFSSLSLMRNWREVHMFYMMREVGKIWTCSCWEKGNLMMINEFKYGQTWKIWPSPLSLSLYSIFKLKSFLFLLNKNYVKLSWNFFFT